MQVHPVRVYAELTTRHSHASLVTQTHGWPCVQDLNILSLKCLKHRGSKLGGKFFSLMLYVLMCCHRFHLVFYLSSPIPGHQAPSLLAQVPPHVSFRIQDYLETASHAGCKP